MQELDSDAPAQAQQQAIIPITAKRSEYTDRDDDAYSQATSLQSQQSASTSGLSAETEANLF